MSNGPAILLAVFVVAVMVAATLPDLALGLAAQPSPSSRPCVPPGDTATDLFLPGAVDPVLTRLFTPQGAPPGTYCAIPTDQPLDVLVRDYAARESSNRNAAWTIRPVAALDAFGAAAPYDRPRAALLFGGQRIRLARGPIARGGRIVASLTLASPYPDADLTRLEMGTLVIVFWIGDSGHDVGAR
jgi:hypothetical protein